MIISLLGRGIILSFLPFKVSSNKEKDCKNIPICEIITKGTYIKSANNISNRRDSL